MTTTFYYKKYLNMNDDNARTHLQKHRKLSKHKMNDITLNCNFYNCIGTYIVKKKDIMFMTDDWGECEIIVNPKNAKLIDYGFLNIYDYFTQTFVRTLINAKWLGGGKRLGMSGVLNIDKFYKFMRKIVKKLVIDEPKYIIDFLQSNKYADSKGWMDKCIERMKEGGKVLGVGVASYKKNTNAECIKYYLGLDDGKGGIDYF